jgi:transcriptional regulator of acetoin/glycerol metabolism
MELPLSAFNQALAEYTDGPLQLQEVEKNTILRVIERHNGNITKAAKELGITRTALYRRLEKHDL